MNENIDVIKLLNEKYDINDTHKANIDLPFEYDFSKKITAIIGGSGTGKTTLLKKWFNLNSSTFNFNDERPILEILFEKIKNFDETCKLLFDVGLSCVPVWKNNYNILSNGEKLRFEIAYKLINNDKVIYVDEFTSMLDRQVAKNLTLKINSLVEKYNKNFVLVTAHFDVLDWIKVDRLVDTNLKKVYSPQYQSLITHMNWKLEVYREICGDYLTTIII